MSFRCVGPGCDRAWTGPGARRGPDVPSVCWPCSRWTRKLCPDCGLLFDAPRVSVRRGSAFMQLCWRCLLPDDAELRDRALRLGHRVALPACVWQRPRADWRIHREAVALSRALGGSVDAPRCWS